jgi:formyltetrahydrofolate-dependent phosphoribosylglycinamide formyltransferase
MAPDPLRIAALISGGGRTVMNLLDEIEEGRLPARIELVVASREDAKGLQRARLRGLETAVVPSRDFRRGGRPDWDAMSRAVDEVMLPHRPELVVLAGYMCLYVVPPELEHRVMNIHPALIPAFCGQGMWGHHVHEAALARGVKVSGCTVHFVTNEYDAGPIIVQRCCPVLETDSPDDLAARVFEEERRAYPEAIRLFAEGRLSVVDGVVRVAPQAD